MNGRAYQRLNVLVMTAIVVAAACASPLPTLPPESPTESASATVATSTATPATTAPLAHWSDSGFAFDYPADWQIVKEGGLNNAIDFTLVVVGTGDWKRGCVSEGGGTSCSDNILLADPGEVIAEFSVRGHGPAAAVFDPPPFDSLRTNSNLPLTVTDDLLTTKATVYVAGRSPLHVNVMYGLNPTDGDREAVHRVLQSVTFTGETSSATLLTWHERDSARCDSSFVGRLGRGNFGGLNLLSPENGAALPHWPDDWSGSIRADGRVDLRDANQTLVAREWDEVSVAGRDDRTGGFRVCGDMVRRVASFPD